jgi:hypothetical protein
MYNTSSMEDTYRGLCSRICRQVLEQQWRVCCKRPGTRRALCQQQQEGPAWSCGRRLMPITSATLPGCSAFGRQADNRMLQSCSSFLCGMVLLDPADSLPEDRHGSLHTHASCSVRSPSMQNFKGIGCRLARLRAKTCQRGRQRRLSASASTCSFFSVISAHSCLA